jgi:alpha-ribazole phosphatase
LSAPTRWWWIRHAPVNDGGRIYGHRDVPADVSDAAAFAVLARWLPREAVWVTSHLQRTAQTARALEAAGADFAEPHVVPDLAEQNMGDWQGEIRAEIIAKHGDPRGFWLAPAETTPPGGESFADLCVRVASAIERLSAEHAGRDIVAVTHGGTIRAALGHALGLAPAAALAFTTDNLALTRIDHAPARAGGEATWRVVTVNLVPKAGG